MKLFKAPFIIAALSYTVSAVAQSTAGNIETVKKAETEFNKLIAKKGIKDAFMAVADPEGMVFKPEAVKITDFYGNIDKQPGTLVMEPKFARIAAAGDLAVAAGPYIYAKSKDDDDKVYGNYVSIWRADADKKLKLLFNLGIQHPEKDSSSLIDMKEPAPVNASEISKDPFKGKSVVINTDKVLNHSLQLSTVGTYKEFFDVEGHFYFPGFAPMEGQDQIMKFLANQDVNITAETVNAGRSLSNDLAYTYGRARIRKGNVVGNYNYVRVWNMDAKHRWNVLLEVFSAVENE